jgi:hypothetical protein
MLLLCSASRLRKFVVNGFLLWLGASERSEALLLGRLFFLNLKILPDKAPEVSGFEAA